MTLTSWRETEPLPEGEAWLLEASAGTGKTFQIAGLVVRLVAEYGLPIERVLAITFTNAATAELRDRVRRRLALVLRHLRAEGSENPGGASGEGAPDALVVHLRALVSPPRAELMQRLEVALRDFDLAGISTIHGFSQRMLAELAFDSGQDPELSLLADPGVVLEQLVDDELARFFHGASAEEVQVYRAAGLGRERLLRVARALCAAVEPEVRPRRAAGDAEVARARVQAFLAMRDRVCAGFLGSAAAPAMEALRAHQDAIAGGHYLAGRVAQVQAWLAEGAPPIGASDATRRNALEALRAPAFQAAFEKKQAKAPGARKRSARTSARAGLAPGAGEALEVVEAAGAAGGDLGAQPFWPALVALDAFATAAEAFWMGFSPLADAAIGLRDRFDREVRRRRLLTFDGMLARLAERIREEGGSHSPLARRLRERYEAVLVDEFQDTDAAQWTVLEAAFLHHRRLFLIGDPKQAIYAFRGADVHVYSRAARALDPERRRTMKTNWRSTPRAIGAMNALWREGSRAFDEDAFDYVEVAPPPGVHDVVSPGDDIGPGVALRFLDGRLLGGAPGEPVKSKGALPMAKMVAAEVVRWLGAGAGAAPEGAAPRRPGEIAVLVNDHRQAAAVARALREARVPAVTAARDNVCATPVASWLARWLDAVASAGRDRDARAAVVTPLFGWTADDLAWALAFADGGASAREEARRAGRAPEVQGRTDAWEAWTARLHEAAGLWPRWGFARVFDRELLAHGVLPRLLRHPEGERHATDLRHLFELLHARERQTRAGPAALAAWLRAEAEVADPERAQRLESDADAVQVETLHASKGLEYPFVLLPWAWEVRSRPDQPGPVVLRSEEGTLVDLSPQGSEARAAALAQAAAQASGEELRKLYVALTRARQQTLAWYGPVGQGGHRASQTALGRLLLRPAGAVGFPAGALPDFAKREEDGEGDGGGPWQVACARLDDLAARSAGAFAWAPAEMAPRDILWREPASPPAAHDPSPRAAAPWPATRTSLRGTWAVTSYTGLAAQSAIAAGHTLPGDEDAEAAWAQEALRALDEHSAPAPALDPPPLRTPGPHEGLRHGRGTAYGNLVHALFEKLDFSSATPHEGGTLAALVQGLAAQHGLSRDPALVSELVDKVPAILQTPLAGTHSADGGVALLAGLPSRFALADLARCDRVDELAFDLRLGAGTQDVASGTGAGAGRIDPRGVAWALEASLAAPAASVAPVRAWLTHHLRRATEGHSLIDARAGILTGAIDLVFRVRAGPGEDERYFLADYKTNRIATSEAGHYEGAWLSWKMATSGYPLQALLYTVALHRHLRLRLGARYDYERHMGGYLYLFVRGMTGADTPRDPDTGHCRGVFAHRWPQEAIEVLDRALAPEATT